MKKREDSPANVRSKWTTFDPLRQIILRPDLSCFCPSPSGLDKPLPRNVPWHAKADTELYRTRYFRFASLTARGLLY